MWVKDFKQLDFKQYRVRSKWEKIPDVPLDHTREMVDLQL